MGVARGHGEPVLMPILVQIDAYDPIADAAVTLRMASDDDASVCQMVGQIWWPVLDKLPTLAMDFFGGEFGAVTTPAASLSLAVEPWPDFARYAFADARLRIFHGDYGADWAGYTLRFDGRVTAQPVVENGRAQIGFAVDDQWLDTPILATYAGTGGIEGAAAMKGNVKPLAIGAPMGVPGVMLDPVKSIIQLSAYGAIESVDVPLERLARQFGSPVADYPTYAALDAAVVPAGQWATARAVGLVKMGAPPYGKLCFLMKGDKGGADGWVRRPGAIIKRLASLSGGAAKVSETSVDALDVARPYDLSVYYDSQTTARSAIQDIAASVNALAGVSLTGQLIVVPIQINAAGLTLRADGSSLPIVGAVRSLGNSAPWWRLAIGAQPFFDVHGQGDYATATSPEAGATRGAPAGTRVAGRDAADLVNQTDYLDSAVYMATQDAFTARSMAEEVFTKLSYVLDDGILSRDERPEVVQAYDQIIYEQEGIENRAAAYGITTERTAYHDAINALSAYLDSLSLPNSPWYDYSFFSQDRVIDRGVFTLKFVDVYTARQALLNKISEVAGERALWSNVAQTPNAPENNATRNVNRGAWSAASVAYAVGDFVQRDGSSYSVITAHTSTASNGPPGANWALLASQGAAGATGPAGAAGAAGATGAPAITGFLTNEAIQLFSYANGGVASYAPATGSFRVFSGNTDVSGSFSLSTVSNPQALTVSYTGQTYSVTAGFDVNEDTATLTIRATGSGAYAGVTLDKVLSLSKAKGGYEIVSALPTTNLFEGRIVFLTSDDKLYRYNGAAWTRAVDGADIQAETVTANAIAVGAVTAAKMNVTSLSAITANIGLLRTATTGARMEIESNQMRSYDGNGTLRVRLGVW